MGLGGQNGSTKGLAGRWGLWEGSGGLEGQVGSAGDQRKGGIHGGIRELGAG